MRSSFTTLALFGVTFFTFLFPGDSSHFRVDANKALERRLKIDNARLIRENMLFREALIELSTPRRTNKRNKYPKYILPPSNCTKKGLCIEKQFDPDHYIACEDTYFLPACLTMCKNDFVECTKRVQTVKNALPDFTLPGYERKQIMLNLEKESTVSKILNPYTPDTTAKPKVGAKGKQNMTAQREAVEESNKKELNATLNKMFSASLKPGGGAAMASMMQKQVEEGQLKQKKLMDKEKKAKKSEAKLTKQKRDSENNEDSDVPPSHGKTEVEDEQPEEISRVKKLKL